VSDPEVSELRRTARVAGFAYLMVILSATPSQMIVRGSIVVPGDAVTTAANLLASESAYRLALVGDLFAFLFDIVIAVAFYRLFVAFDPTRSLLCFTFHLASTAISGINLLNHVVPLLILHGGDYLTVFDPAQRDALVLLALRAHTYGYLIGITFFAVSLLVLGNLFYRSRFIPRFFPVFLIVGATILLAGIFGLLLFPEYRTVISPGFLLLDALAEWSLCGWLLVRGVKGPPGGGGLAGTDRAPVPGEALAASAASGS